MKSTRIPWLVGILLLPFTLAFVLIVCLIAMFTATVAVIFGTLTGRLTFVNNKLKVG